MYQLRRTRPRESSCRYQPAQLSGGETRLPQCGVQCVIERSRHRKVGTLRIRRLFGFGCTRQPDHFVCCDAQLARSACARQDDRPAQIDRILRHAPAAVNVGDMIIALMLGNELFGCKSLRELRVRAGQRFGRHRRAILGHLDKIVMAAHPTVNTPRIFEQRIGKHHRYDAVADFGAAQYRES